MKYISLYLNLLPPFLDPVGILSHLRCFQDIQVESSPLYLIPRLLSHQQTVINCQSQCSTAAARFYNTHLNSWLDTV